MKSKRPWKFMEASSPGARPKERGLFSSIRFRFFWLNRNKRRPTQVWWLLWQYVLILTFAHLTRFLVMFFGSSGPNIMTGDPSSWSVPVKVNLPKAYMWEDLRQGTPVILIGEDKVVLLNDRYCPLDEISMEQVDLADRLFSGLETTKAEFKSLHPNIQFYGFVSIGANQDTPFSTLRNVMDVCSAAGYINIDLVVAHTVHHK